MGDRREIVVPYGRITCRKERGETVQMEDDAVQMCEVAVRDVVKVSHTVRDMSVRWL